MNSIRGISRWSFGLAFALALLLSTQAHSAGSGQLGLLDTSRKNPNTGREWAIGDQYRLVFITSERIDPLSDAYGNLDDISTWNAFVQTVAHKAGGNLGTVSWSVIGSSAGTSARDNTRTNPVLNGIGHPIILIDGSTIVANNYTDLWDGTLRNTIIMNEKGGIAGEDGVPSAFPYTGTRSNGTAMSPNGVLRALSAGEEIRQGMASNAAGWVDRGAISAPAQDDRPLPVYAMSEALSVLSASAASRATDTIPEASTGLLVGLAALPLFRRRR